MSTSMAASRALLRLMSPRVAVTWPPSSTAGSTRARRRCREPCWPVSRSPSRSSPGIPVIRLTPRTGSSGQHLIYTHGGAYVRPLLGCALAHDRRRRPWTPVSTVTVPLYRLAPESSAAEAYPALRAVYEQVVAEADAVTLAGDSAGGGLALGQAIDHRDRGLPPARQVLLFAPWLDLELRHPGIPALQALDAMLRVDALREAGRLWARDQNPADPLLSPIRADLTGLPPVHVYQGGRDILAADARDLAVRLRAAGNPGTATWVDGGFHVYVAATWTPESRHAFSQVRALLAPSVTHVPQPGARRAAATTPVRMRPSAGAAARSVGAATDSAAITAPSAPRTGAPTDTTPTRLSSRFSAHPRSATSRSRVRSVASSTIVNGVWRRGTQCSRRRSSSSGSSAARRALPVLVVVAGSRVPTREKMRTVCGLSRRSM